MTRLNTMDASSSCLHLWAHTCRRKSTTVSGLPRSLTTARYYDARTGPKRVIMPMESHLSSLVGSSFLKIKYNYSHKNTDYMIFLILFFPTLLLVVSFPLWLIKKLSNEGIEYIIYALYGIYGLIPDFITFSCFLLGSALQVSVMAIFHQFG